MKTKSIVVYGKGTKQSLLSVQIPIFQRRWIARGLGKRIDIETPCGVVYVRRGAAPRIVADEKFEVALKVIYQNEETMIASIRTAIRNTIGKAWTTMLEARA